MNVKFNTLETEHLKPSYVRMSYGKTYQNARKGDSVPVVVPHYRALSNDAQCRKTAYPNIILLRGNDSNLIWMLHTEFNKLWLDQRPQTARTHILSMVNRIFDPLGFDVPFFTGYSDLHQKITALYSEGHSFTESVVRSVAGDAEYARLVANPEATVQKELIAQCPLSHVFMNCSAKNTRTLAAIDAFLNKRVVTKCIRVGKVVYREFSNHLTDCRVNHVSGDESQCITIIRDVDTNEYSYRTASDAEQFHRVI